MNQPPRVSVILPTFNRSGYLRQAIESVLAQTYANFEIILVDDGSTDDTPAAVAAFGDPRIVYLRQNNQGRSAARNTGLRQARGEYIAFLDDDDLYLPQKLASQTAFLDAHTEIGLVAGGAQIIAADGAFLRNLEPWENQPELSLPGCLYSCPLLTCAVLLRRQWLEALDHWFDPAMDHAEDTDLWIRLLIAGCRMSWLPLVVSAYRQHPGNSRDDTEVFYQRGYLLLLDKLYSRNDLPPSVRNERSKLYARHHIIVACHAYAAGQLELGQERLLEAASAMPEAVTGRPPLLVRFIVDRIQNEDVADPFALAETIFNHLPYSLAELRLYRRYALSLLHMRRVFTAPGQFQVRDWLLGVYLHPRWLTNRGVWATLARSLFQRLASRRLSGQISLL